MLRRTSSQGAYEVRSSRDRQTRRACHKYPPKPSPKTKRLEPYLSSRSESVPLWAGVGLQIPLEHWGLVSVGVNANTVGAFQASGSAALIGRFWASTIAAGGRAGRGTTTSTQAAGFAGALLPVSLLRPLRLSVLVGRLAPFEDWDRNPPDLTALVTATAGSLIVLEAPIGRYSLRHLS